MAPFCGLVMENVKTVTTNFNRYIYVFDFVRHDSVPWLVASNLI